MSQKLRDKIAKANGVWKAEAEHKLEQLMRMAAGKLANPKSGRECKKQTGIFTISESHADTYLFSFAIISRSTP